MTKTKEKKSNKQKVLGVSLIIFLLLIFSFVQQNVMCKVASNEKPLSYDDPRLLKAYMQAVWHFNPSMSYEEADTIVRSLISYSVRYRLDPRFVVAVVAVESAFHTYATSKAGAQGLGQLMPGTARSLGINDAYEPTRNLEGTVRYLRLNLDRWGHLPPQQKYELALASYNAGYNAVKQYGGIPPYPETKWYIYNVIVTWRRLAGLR